MLVGSLNGDLTGVKLAAGTACGNHIAFLMLSAGRGGVVADGIRKGLELEEPEVA